MTLSKKDILNAAKKVEKWVEDQNYKGYEPFDGLSSRFRPLTFGSLLLDRILLQLIRQSPINLRPLLGVKPLDSTIGRGYMAWGYCHMYKATQDPDYERKARLCLDWLIENKSPGYEEYSWGKHFDFASRGGLYKAFEPILVWSALICHGFLEAYETFGEERYLDIAESVCRWIAGLPRNRYDRGFCLGYHYHDHDADIHNSNMVGAAVLARAGKHTGNQEFLEIARGAMEFSCSKQRADGSWLYGENPMNHWIDNFHSGYNLDALKCYIEYTGDNLYNDHLDRGIRYYVANFFEPSGRPKYYHNRAYPIDSQCISQSIDTLSNFSDHTSEISATLDKVFTWTQQYMMNPDGTVQFRHYPIGVKAKTPMLHWAQATMYKSLSLFLLNLSSSK